MPPREWRERVQDILDALAAIQEFTRGFDLTSLAADSKTKFAVVYQFIIIGEAARSISEEVKKAHPEVPWADMNRMRNFVTHVYHAIDVRVLWDAIQNDLPPLPPLLRGMLGN